MRGATGPGRKGDRPGGDRPGPDDRAGVERVVVWLVVLAAVAGVVGSVWFVGDDVRRDFPDSEFSATLDAETGILTVRHAGGDTIRNRGTESLTVVVTDAETNATTSVTWAGDPPRFSKRGEGFPVDVGAVIAIDDPTVDSDGDGSTLDEAASVGFELSDGDEVHVVWRGSRRTETSRTITLANVTVG